jgi:hypothetical protein
MLIDVPLTTCTASVVVNALTALSDVPDAIRSKSEFDVSLNGTVYSVIRSSRGIANWFWITTSLVSPPGMVETPRL